MKKIVFLVFALIIAAACAAPPTNQPTTNRAAEPVAAAPMTEADAIAKEKAIWEALKTKNYDAFGNMLATDYIEILPDGINDKAETLTEVKDLEITDVTFADWRFIPVDKDASLILYNATIKGKFKGLAFPEGPYRVSSGLVNRDGKWQAIYYQETMVEKEPPPPSPGPSATATASPSIAASPGTSPAPSTLPTDPIAREKMAWDALKRRDYDAFASYLDPAQVEVESTGVYDKAGTLNGVRTFDASKAELSDFRTVKINPNTDLVTYLITVAGPTPEKHLATTIWVNRGGKWAALFHQGTTMRAPSASASPSPSPSTTATAK
jgi:hypothetical protein